MAQPRKAQLWSLSTLLSAVTSIVCMGSMGAMGVAASVGAAATSGMAGMEVTGSTPPAHIALTTQLLQSIGLTALTQIPDTVLRPVFVFLLGVGIVGSYLASRAHKHRGPLVLTILAAVLLYVGIYVIASDPLYYVSLGLLLVGSVWNVRVRPASSPAIIT